MELELVSLPCQTVNSLGAATRAINPLLVLQFSTQPRTAINNRPLSKVDQPSSISRGFPEVSEIPFSVIIIFFPLPSSFYCGDPDFRCPSSWQEGVPCWYWQQQEVRKETSGLDRGEKEIRVLWSRWRWNSWIRTSRLREWRKCERLDGNPSFRLPFSLFRYSRLFWFMLD